MDASHVVGWLLLVGSVTFGIGAGDPYLIRAWTAPQETFLAIIARHPVAWRASNVLFIGATVLTASGLAALPSLLPDGWPRALALAGAAAFAIAAVLWIVSLIYRLVVPPGTARGFTDTGTLDASVTALDRLSGGLFKAFMVIALAALAAIGVATTAGRADPGSARLGIGSPVGAASRRSPPHRGHAAVHRLPRPAGVRGHPVVGGVGSEGRRAGGGLSGSRIERAFAQLWTGLAPLGGRGAPSATCQWSAKRAECTERAVRRSLLERERARALRRGPGAQPQPLSAAFTRYDMG